MINDNGGSTVEYRGYKLPAHLARDLELFEFLLEDLGVTRAQIEAALSAKLRPANSSELPQ